MSSSVKSLRTFNLKADKTGTTGKAVIGVVEFQEISAAEATSSTEGKDTYELSARFEDQTAYEQALREL